MTHCELIETGTLGYRRSAPQTICIDKWSRGYPQSFPRELLEMARRVVDSSPLIGTIRVTASVVHEQAILIVEDTHHASVSAFKQRGAVNALAAARRKGATVVVAASTGNHGQSVTAAAGTHGIHAIVFVPANTPELKLRKMEALGAEVRISESESYDDAAAEAAAFALQADIPFLHPFDNRHVIAGQGTLLHAIVRSIGCVPASIIAPVGGGGLAAGLVATAEHYYDAHPRITGVEPARRPSLLAALEVGAPTPIEFASTLAQGANVGRIGERPFGILRHGLHAAAAVQERQIAEAMRELLRLGVAAEGAGALAYAAVLDGIGFEEPSSGPIVAIVSGASIETVDQRNPKIL
jgi:threonine dehydratase